MTSGMEGEDQTGIKSITKGSTTETTFSASSCTKMSDPMKTGGSLHILLELLESIFVTKFFQKVSNIRQTMLSDPALIRLAAVIEDWY
jgi:hypothetical protein